MSEISPSTDATVPVLRRFNRTYTQRIGVLDDSYLGTGRPLNVSRVLFEIAPAQPVTMQRLRQQLRLDSGYLSRLLARLEADGLIRIEPDPADRRRRIVTTTAAGRRAAAELEDRSETRARQLVATLTERQRARLARALGEAELLVRAATVEFEEVPSDDPAARAARQTYFDELAARFPQGFTPTAGPAIELPVREIVAMSEGAPVACGAVRRLDAHTAEVKHLWAHPGWRGSGLGSRMLRRLERLAAEDGARSIVLDTNGTLAEAICLYRHAGYVEIPRYNDNPYAELFFEKRLDAEPVRPEASPSPKPGTSPSR